MVNSMTRFLAVDSAKVDLKERKDKLNNSKTEYLSLDDIRGYKVYTALLTQTGTNAPVATVLENTIGDIWFTYNNAGEYYINSSELFVLDKVYISITNNIDVYNFGGFWSIAINPVSTEQLYLTTGNIDKYVNEILNATPIEIRVYN